MKYPIAQEGEADLAFGSPLVSLSLSPWSSLVGVPAVEIEAEDDDVV